LDPTLTRTLTTSRHESRGSFDKNFNLFSFNLLPQELSFNFQVAFYGFLNVFYSFSPSFAS
jgi:hypothetical protein